jgi:16S rRNA (uracil1498-N3)-methyltransferase
MRLTRVFVDAPLAAGAKIALRGSAASHVTRVLRLRVGEPLTLFNGEGGEFAGTLEKSRGGEVTVLVGEHSARERESPLALTLAQGVSRGERMDLVVQKATELGVTCVVPLLTERSVVRFEPQQADRKSNHWRAIAVAACEQSARNRLPRIMSPVPLRDFLRSAAAEPAPARRTPAAARLLLCPAGGRRMREIEGPLSAITVLIGPEGGLTHEEQDAAVAAGFAPLRLGPRMLRTETAAIAALTLLQQKFGDL